MKKIIYFVIFLSFLVIPSFVKADQIYYSCENTNLTKLQRLASNVVYTYDYIEIFTPGEKYGNVTFNVKISNLNPSLYLVDKKTGAVYGYTGNELIFSNILPEQALSYAVYANDYGCAGKYLMTIYINLPSYNKYYIDDLCKKHQENKLCSKWNKVDLTYEQFKNKLMTYDTDEDIDGKEEEHEKTFEEIFEEIIYFLDENKLIIFVPIIIISSLLIICLKYMKNKEMMDLK